MSPVATFLIGLAITLAISLTAVVYLRSHLQRILTDLCGTATRASFWTAFSNVSLVLVPLVFALFVRPDGGEDATAVFEISRQLRWALIALVLTVLVLGRTLSRSIRRQEACSR